MKRYICGLLICLSAVLSGCRQRSSEGSDVLDASPRQTNRNKTYLTVPEKFKDIGLKSNFVKASDGVLIHFYTVGSGSPVLLIHGAGLDGAVAWFYNGIGQALAKNHMVIAMDQRGSGRSGGSFEDFTGLYSDPILILDHLKIDKAYVHGYSFGGSTTMRLMELFGTRIKAAVIGGMGPMSNEPLVPPAPDEEVDTPEYRKIEADASELVAKLNVEHQALLARWIIIEPAPTINELGKDYGIDPAIVGVESDFSKVNFPVMTLVGAHDGAQQHTARFTRELKDYKRVIFPERGHISLVAPGFIPDQYINELQNFFSDRQE